MIVRYGIEPLHNQSLLQVELSNLTRNFLHQQPVGRTVHTLLRISRSLARPDKKPGKLSLPLCYTFFRLTLNYFLEGF